MLYNCVAYKNKTMLNYQIFYGLITQYITIKFVNILLVKNIEAKNSFTFVMLQYNYVSLLKQVTGFQVT